MPSVNFQAWVKETKTGHSWDFLNFSIQLLTGQGIKEQVWHDADFDKAHREAASSREMTVRSHEYKLVMLWANASQHYTTFEGRLCFVAHDAAAPIHWIYVCWCWQGKAGPKIWLCTKLAPSSSQPTSLVWWPCCQHTQHMPCFAIQVLRPPPWSGHSPTLGWPGRSLSNLQWWYMYS